MNDPGLDSTVANVDREVEQNPFQRLQQEEEEEERDFLDPR